MVANSIGDITETWGSLTIVDEDDTAVVVNNIGVMGAGRGYELCLVGKLATDRHIKFPFFRDTIAAVWRPGKGVNIKEIQQNLYFFQFFHEADVQRTVEDGPWSYEQNLLVIRRLKPNEEPHEVALNTAEFWVQVHNLPLGFISEKIVTAVGSSIGEVIKMDQMNFDGNWKSFIRVRVKIDILKPLKRRLKMKKNDGDWIWVEFKYERLPTFCFLCGTIGHAERFRRMVFDGVQGGEEKPYGAWLRAGSRRAPPSAGQRWLVPDSPKEREKWKAPVWESNHGNPGNHGEGILGKEGKNKETKDFPSQKEKEIKILGREETTTEQTLVVNDPKRKRVMGSSLQSDELVTVMDVDFTASKNVLGAGPALQARRD